MTSTLFCVRGRCLLGDKRVYSPYQDNYFSVEGRRKAFCQATNKKADTRFNVHRPIYLQATPANDAPAADDWQSMY